jgi:UDP-glucose 4-epimerase
MSKYLITGGCGFIGSHLADALVARGHTVCILDDLSTGKRENAPASAALIVGDVADAALVRSIMSTVDGCFHLAAIASVQRSTDDWLGAHRTNLTGAIAVFDAARQNTGRRLPVVYASSAAVYGDNSNTPLSESAERRPLTAYGADKLGCELHANVAWHVHKVPTFGLRFFNVFGPRQDPSSPYSGVISIFADRIATQQPLTIFGDGQQVRDFIFVSDVVAHLIAAMERCQTGAEVLNVCTGKATSVAQLALVMGNLIGCRPEINYGAARTGDIRVSIGDPSRAVQTLGVAASYSLVDGLRATFDGQVSRRRPQAAGPRHSQVFPSAGE